MTIKQRETIQNFSQQKQVLVFDEKNGELSETACIELLQESNLQQKLWKTLCNAASHHQQVTYNRPNILQCRQVEGEGDWSSKQSDKEHINLERKTDSSNDQLLVLAHSAALMLESDSLSGNDQNQEAMQSGLHITPMAHSSGCESHATVADHESPREDIEDTPGINYLRTEEDGFQRGGRTPRLSQVRRKARSIGNLLAQHSMEGYAVENSQGKKVRLNHIRHQARLKNHSQLQDRNCSYSCGDSKRRVIRMSDLRRQARSKGNPLVQKTIEDHTYGHPDFQISEVDNQKRKIIADIFGEEDGPQGFQDADCHLSEVDSVHSYNQSDRVIQSVSEREEVQEKMVFERGRMRLSRLRREAHLGKASTLGEENNCAAIV